MSFPAPRPSSAASSQAPPPPPTQLPQGDQHPFQDYVAQGTVLRFNRLSENEPYITCKQCWSEGKEVKIYLGRLPWQTRCSVCRSSFTAQQVNQYHTKILSAIEFLPWRQYLKYDFSVVPKLRAPWWSSELPETAPSAEGSQTTHEEPIEVDSDAGSAFGDLPEKVDKFLSKCEEQLQSVMPKLRGRGFSERILRDQMALVRDCSVRCEDFRRDLELAISDLQEALGRVDHFAQEGPLSEALEQVQLTEERLQSRSSQWLDESTENEPESSDPAAEYGSLSQEDQKLFQEFLAQKRKHQ